MFKKYQIFDEAGNVIPVTILRAKPVIVTQVKTKERDRYEAVQVGLGEKKKKGSSSFRWLREFPISPADLKLGDKIELTIFKEGEPVQIRGVSKGKGFQGVVKRHGFHGGPRTHGQKHSEREPGSIGATWPQRVLKGKKMAGRMGGERVTIKNSQIVKIEPDKNLLYVKGAVPGARGSLIQVGSE